MNLPSLDDVRAIANKVVLPFYQIERDMPLPFNTARQENDAEHSWSLAILACALAAQMRPLLDTGKVAQFAIVHDLAELHAGDTSNFASDMELKSKQAREAASLERIRKETHAFPWLLEYIEAYERKDTEEALFVYALDKFLANLIAFEGKGYHHRRPGHRRLMAERKAKLAAHRRKAHSHKVAAYYYEALEKAFEAHPEYFYQELQGKFK